MYVNSHFRNLVNEKSLITEAELKGIIDRTTKVS